MSSPSPCPATASNTSSSVSSSSRKIDAAFALKIAAPSRRSTEQRRVELLGAEDAGRDGVVEAVAAHPATLFAVRERMLLSWNGVRPGCLPRISAQIPEMCGVAKLLPVQRSVVPSSHATSSSSPRAKNSTGGSG